MDVLWAAVRPWLQATGNSTFSSCPPPCSQSCPRLDGAHCALRFTLSLGSLSLPYPQLRAFTDNFPEPLLSSPLLLRPPRLRFTFWATRLRTGFRLTSRALAAIWRLVMVSPTRGVGLGFLFPSPLLARTLHIPRFLAATGPSLPRPALFPALPCC